jgi:carboxypeptidase Taq
VAPEGARQPAELGALRQRLAELADLHGTAALLSWDQNTFMPHGGAEARAEQLATIERLAHERLVDPELARLLDRLEPWTQELDPDSDEARLVACTRRDHMKAACVPGELAVAMVRESARGYEDWLAARETGEFSRFRDALARQVELRLRYVACFPGSEHPYDVLLDDFEPGMTTAEVRPLFDGLVEQLGPLVEAAADPDSEPNGGVFGGHFDVDQQRVALLDVLGLMGFDEVNWRLDTAPHPFAQSPGHGDYRITTRYRADDFAYSFYSALHEFGHGLYDAGLPAHLRRTNLHECASLGVHESQSRLWENVIGRGLPYCIWALPQFKRLFPGLFDGLDARGLYRAVNTVQRSLIRTESDETTYNLHIALRFELELALLEQRLEVDDLPAAWNEGMERLVGIEVPSDADGVLQDVHWSIGSFGYFPTYTLGNLMSAQLWEKARADLGDPDGQIERGDFAPLREWLHENVHRHGRKFPPRDLLRRATGQELAYEPFLDYLRTKLSAAGVMPAAS